MAELSHAGRRPDGNRRANWLPGSVHLGVGRSNRLVREQQGCDWPLSESFGRAFRRRPLRVPRRAREVSRGGGAVPRKRDARNRDE